MSDESNPSASIHSTIQRRIGEMRLWQAADRLDPQKKQRVDYSMCVFVGLGLSRIWKKPIGTWVNQKRTLEFFSAKRDVRLPPAHGWMEALPRDNPAADWEASFDLGRAEFRKSREEDGSTVLVGDQPDAGEVAGEGVG